MACLCSTISGAFTEETQTAGSDSDTQELEEMDLMASPRWLLHSCVSYLNWDDQRLDSDGTVDLSAYVGSPSIWLRLFTA